VEEVVRRFVDQPPTEPTTARVTPRREGISLAEVEEILSEQLATRVSIQMGRKRGRIVIEFGSADDLERIVSEIIGSGPGLAPSN
jgi:ParB family chromosome partitioning protein